MRMVVPGLGDQFLYICGESGKGSWFQYPFGCLSCFQVPSETWTDKNPITSQEACRVVATLLGALGVQVLSSSPPLLPRS